VLAEKNGGVPEYGTIQQREAVGVFEYTDPKGRKPVSYTKVMKKYKVSEEQVLAEAGKFGMVINGGHFVVAEAAESKRGRPKVAAEKVSEPKGPKGRPKKSKKVLEIAGEEHEDLFAAMVANAQEDSDSEDEGEMQAKEAEKAALAKQKAAELAMQKAAELAKQKAEKEAKKAAFDEAKAAKKAALEAKKVKKEATKQKEEMKQKEEPKQKKASKQEQAASKQEQVAPKEEPAAAKAESSEEESETISCKEKTVDGKKYLISKGHLVYDHHEWTVNGEQVVIGKWNKAEKKIEFTAESESEESEEEYDEE
jgi:chemotaxis protein histidine kinase CheA